MMLKDDLSTAPAAARPFTATAFREDGGARLVTITDLAFDKCRIWASPPFAFGERLRLHLHGQGWIEAEVHALSGEDATLLFVTKSRC